MLRGKISNAELLNDGISRWSPPRRMETAEAQMVAVECTHSKDVGPCPRMEAPMKSIGGAIILLFLGGAWSAPAQQYTISTLAGGSPPATPVRALEMPISGFQYAIATDIAGNVYFSSFDCVFKLERTGRALGAGRREPTGIVTRVAGNSRVGYEGDYGPAVDAELSAISALAVDARGNLFIADGRHVRKVSPDGIITTVAGNGASGYSGDGGLATDAPLDPPAGLAVDSAGNLFITSSERVRKVTPAGIITTIAGGGAIYGLSSDGGPATSAALENPQGVAVDSAGNVFVADLGDGVYFQDDSGVIRKVSPDGIITTVAGAGGGYNKVCVAGASADGRPGTAVTLCVPSTLTFDSAGNLLIVDSSIDYPCLSLCNNNFVVLKLSPDGALTTVAGTSSLGLAGPNRIAADGAGNLLIAAASGHRILGVSPAGIVSTVAGNGQCCYYDLNEIVPATSVQLHGVYGLAVDGAGNVFIAESNDVRKVSPDGIMTTLATGTANIPTGVAADLSGNLFVADYFEVVRISPDGSITTVAGNGTPGYSGDGGPATEAQLHQGWLGNGGLAVDSRGNLWIADSGNNRIRKVTPDGIITTVAGNGAFGYSGDGGPATQAQITPYSVAVDGAGNLFFSDGNRIRKVSPDGIITTVSGIASGAITVDSSGNLFIACCGRIRKVSADSIITTVAGNGGTDYYGDGGLATDASLGILKTSENSIVADAAGSVYILDVLNGAVRVLRPR